MNSCKVAFALSIILLPTIFYCDKLLAQSPVAAETTDAMMPLSLIPRWNKESPWIVVDQNPKYPRRSNPYVGNEVAHQVYWATERHREVTDESGHFQIAVLPGKGHLMVKAPTDEYESQNVSRGELFCGEPKLDYYCMESLQAIDPMPGDEPLKITLALRVGRRFAGTFLGRNKEPVEQALLLSATYSPLWINIPNLRPRPVQTEWQVRGAIAAKPTRTASRPRHRCCPTRVGCRFHHGTMSADISLNQRCQEGVQ